MSFDRVIFYFFLYCFLGFLLELASRSVMEKKLVYPGFLHGPWLPIYGFGAVSVLAFLGPLADRPVVFILAAMGIATLLELVTGVLLEKLLGTRLWDYSHKPFNFMGLVALEYSFYWGVLSYVFLYYLHPLVEKLTAPLESGGLMVVMKYVILPAMVVDTALSINKAIQLRSNLSALELIAKEIEELKEEAGERLEELKSHYEGLVDKLLKANKQLLIYSKPFLTSRRFPKVVKSIREVLSVGREKKGKKEK